MTYILFTNGRSKIKEPGMADMPGESQEEPSVMVSLCLRRSVNLAA